MVLALRPTSEEVASLSGQVRPWWWSAVPSGLVKRGVDDLEAAQTAIGHLSGSAHPHRPPRRRPDPEHAGLDFSTPVDRLLGYRMTMEVAGLRIERGWEVTGDFTALGGLAACRQLLAGGPRPTAIFAGSNEMAIGASHAVREAGLRVPTTSR